MLTISVVIESPDYPREKPDLPRHQAGQLPHWQARIKISECHSRR